MQTNVLGLFNQDVLDIAEYFSSRPPVRASFTLDETKVARGKSKAMELNCAGCRRPDYSGKNESPRLAGMEPGYTSREIVGFTTGEERLHPLIDEKIGLTLDYAEDLAQFFAHLE